MAVPPGTSDRRGEPPVGEPEVDRDGKESLELRRRKDRSEAVVGAEGFEEVGERDEAGQRHERLGEKGDRIVDPADQEDQAHSGPGGDLGPQAEEEEEGADQNPDHSRGQEHPEEEARHGEEPRRQEIEAERPAA